jgi:hypothetical protein
MSVLITMPKAAGSDRMVHVWTRCEKTSKIPSLWAYDNGGKGCEVKDQWLYEWVKCGIKLLSSSICRLKGCGHGKWPVIKFLTITAVHWVLTSPCNLIRELSRTRAEFGSVFKFGLSKTELNWTELKVSRSETELFS